MGPHYRIIHRNELHFLQRQTMIWILANPVAGQGRARRFAERAALQLQRDGITVELHYTHQKGHGYQLAAQAVSEGVETVAVCGGDGTLSEVVPALLNTPTTLGLLPFGTANDFARGLGVPRTLGKAVQTLVEGRAAPIDLGRCGDRYFSTVVAYGFDAEVSAAMEAGQAPLGGTAGYVLQALRHLRRFTPPQTTLSGSFGRFEGPVFLVASANTRSYGGGMQIAPNADPQDGLLDVCIIEPLTYAQALSLLPSVFLGRHIHHPSVHIVRTEALEISGETERLFSADGERCGTTPLRVTSVPKALRVILPTA